MDWIARIDWKAWIGTIALIIIFREGAVWVMQQFNHPEMGNLVGLISLLIVLSLWRKYQKIPASLVDTNNKIMKESAFAFLPISAGSLLMMMHLGDEIPMFLIVLVVSTLIPLWVYAKMSKKWI
ncbi:hypothetical protein [Acinetobacter sp.]|uniref:hypothetical protein n=1 Tax=Acinetobacter sp. TaxID=472 RepID=UPI0025848CA3|nr:hypothetical protein [Acinetobacter sp.]